MPIIGINLKSMQASFDDKKLKGDLEISSTPNIENVEKREFRYAGMNEAIIINFSFKTKYEPGVGEIVLTGDVIYQTEDPKKLVKMWKDEKRLDEETTIDVLNAVFRKCLTKAVQLADDLRLPPPLTFPLVAKKEKK